MSTAAQSEGVVVVVGDPRDPDRDYHRHLEYLARTGDTVEWKVPKGTEVGDIALIYLIRPVSAIVAFATVLSDPVATNAVPDREWGNGCYAELGCFGLLDAPIPRDELLAEVPAWRWPVQPHTAMLPRGDAATQLVDYVASKSLDLRLLQSAASTLQVENGCVYQVVAVGEEFLVTVLTVEQSAVGEPARVVGRNQVLDEALDMMIDQVRMDAASMIRA